MMKREISITVLLFFCNLMLVLGQDEVIFKNGDILKAKVTAVGVDEIKYKKWENIEGPIYSANKEIIFMIKYENGSKDVFTENTQSKSVIAQNAPPPLSGPPAEIYFIRPKKFTTSSPDVIVGTVVPDEVITKVANGRWYKASYTNFGEVEFVAGVYTINPEHFNFTIEPGKTYYVRCSVLSKGFKVMAELQMLDEAQAKAEMSELKEQTKAK